MERDEMASLTTTHKVTEVEISGETFLPLSEETVLVKSQSAAGEWYTLTLYHGRVSSCSCPGFTHRGKCRHADAYRLANRACCDWCGTPTSNLKINGERLCMKCSTMRDEGGLANGFVR